MIDPQRQTPPWTRRALVVAAVVLAVGLWMVLDALGVSPPPLSRHWPLFVLLGGFASLIDFFAVSRRPGALGLGIFGIGLGIVLYLLVQDAVGWTEPRLWIPGVLLAIGLANLATWGVSEARSPRSLVTGVVFSGLAVTFWAWREIPLGLFWGLVLIATAMAIGYSVWQARRRRASSPPSA